MPRHVGDSLQATLQASQSRLAPVAADAMEILSRARDSFDPLAALADGALHADELIWGTKAFRSELTAPRGDDAATSAAQQAKEAKRVRKRALAASRRGRQAPIASCHESAAVALRPRLMRWRDALGLPPDVIVQEATRTLAVATACAPSIIVAVVKSWCDAWPTSTRRGQKPSPCPCCGRPERDEVAHLIRCLELTRAVAQATKIAAPSSLREALCLSGSPRAPTICEKFARPELRSLFLAVQVETYQSLQNEELEAPGAVASRRHRVLTAAKNPRRRLGGGSA